MAVTENRLSDFQFQRLGKPEKQQTQKQSNNVCKFWVSSKCLDGDKCRFRHSWFQGKSFSMVTRLLGHNDDAVSGITIPPSGSDKFFSTTIDGELIVWDCNSCKIVEKFNLGEQIGCLISTDSWVFVGLPNLVKAWKLDSVLGPWSLHEPIGQVCSLVIGNSNWLFAGSQDGSIQAWRVTNSEETPFEFVGSLIGHKLPVTCLIFCPNGSKLYSASMDKTVRVWDIEKFECVNTLTAHTDAVMSVLCWDQYLITCSLDKTFKIWSCGGAEVVYTHKEDYGVILINGACDGDGKPVLVCSCIDKTVRLYELPSFEERGRIFSNRGVEVIQSGPNGLFFTGDGDGSLSVWNWLAAANANNNMKEHTEI